MVSIQSSLSELERSHQVMTAVVDCYSSAIRNVADYAVEFDEELSGPHRRHLNALAAEVASGTVEALEGSTATLRGLLRDYRDKSAHYLGGLRDELAGTARTLEEILDSLGQTDGDHEKTLHTAMGKLRQVAAAPANAALKVIISAAVDSIEQSLEQVRKQHQLTNSQFLVEIRMLHKRIDILEAAASGDELARFATREELSNLVRTSKAGQYCLLLISVRGLLRSEVQFGKAVASELAGAFAKRLRNSLHASAVLARWGAEEFAILLNGSKTDALASAKWITEHLSGPYSCMSEGKSVRPSLQLTVGVIDTAATDTPERILERAGAFLVGQ
ncbi:MAG: GGDEF domain-containing protein [Candidatus Solibacter sp.]